MGTQPPQKGTQPPIFGSCLLWPKGWMDQDVIWYGGRPRTKPYCVRWGPSSPYKGAQPPVFSPCLLWPNCWMDQDATWYEGSAPATLCYMGTQRPPPKKKDTAPNFRSMSIVTKRSLILATAEHLNSHYHAVYFNGLRSA